MSKLLAIIVDKLSAKVKSISAVSLFLYLFIPLSIVIFLMYWKPDLFVADKFSDYPRQWKFRYLLHKADKYSREKDRVAIEYYHKALDYAYENEMIEEFGDCVTQLCDNLNFIGCGKVRFDFFVIVVQEHYVHCKNDDFEINEGEYYSLMNYIVEYDAKSAAEMIKEWPEEYRKEILSRDRYRKHLEEYMSVE